MFWESVVAYRKVSQVESGGGIIPIAIDNRRLQNGSISQVNTRRTVPQKARVAYSLGKEDHGKLVSFFKHVLFVVSGLFLFCMLKALHG